MKKIGVLALQGAVREHIHMIQALGCEAVSVTNADNLIGLHGLVIPGGESTTMRKLLDRFELLEPIRLLAINGLPMFGTCAGLILLAREVVDFEPHVAVIDVKVARNSYGRQVDSFEVDLTIEGIGESVPAVFIRAPHIVSVGEKVKILATYNSRIVLAQDRHLLGCSFHPELTNDTRIMQYFIENVVC